ncbi:MAG: galactose-1-phosphate uridylyltransferase [Armatimonadota bacterium]
MSELRKDPIVDRWVIIAAERGRRPTDFEAPESTTPGAACPLCEGNERMTPPEIWALRPNGGEPDTPGWQVRVVPNKFPALRIEGNVNRRGIGTFDLMDGIGAHEVIIETPDHSWRMADGPPEMIERVLLAYQVRLQDLYRDDRFRYCVIFRNYGPDAGASLSHPHSQIMAVPVTPRRVKSKLNAALAYYERKERCIFCDMLAQELALEDRIVIDDGQFVAFAPFASRFPFELAVYPRAHSHDFCAMGGEERAALARVMHQCLAYLRPALGALSYNFVVNVAPNSSPRPGKPHYWSTLALDYHWHIELLPRVTQIAGFEWGTGFYINPVAPEDAARFLRDVMAEADLGTRSGEVTVPGEGP